jgi:hypothetical protein
MSSFGFRLCLMVALLLPCARPIRATTLTFNACGGGTGTALEGPRCRYATINQDYGDRVTGPSMNGGLMQYGQYGEGWTPNVTVSYGPVGAAIRGWDNNYAGLWTVIWVQDDPGVLTIRMTADPGYQALFHGWRIGGYIFNEGPWPLVIGALSVMNEHQTVLWSQSNVPVTQAGPLYFEFAQPLASGDGGCIEFTMDVRNLPVGAYNRESIGIDQVRFGQRESANPEAASWTLVLPGIAALVYARWRRK